MARGFTLRLGQHLFTLGMPFTLASRITDGDEARLLEPIDVLGMSVNAKGFLFITADDEGNPKLELIYEPAIFSRFLSELSDVSIQREALFKLDTAGTTAVFCLFYSWMKQNKLLFLKRISGQEI